MRMILFLLYYNFCVDECRWIPEVYSNVNTSFYHIPTASNLLTDTFNAITDIRIYTIYGQSSKKRSTKKLCLPKRTNTAFCFYFYFNIRKPISYINIHMIHRRIVPIVVFTTVVTPTYL